MKLLVTGAGGLFGSKLAEKAESLGLMVYSGFSRTVPSVGFPVCFDVSQAGQVQEAFERVKPDVVVHCAALTDVDRCEVDRSLAWRVNVVGTENVVRAVRQQRAPAFLVFVSTDYVFNGEKGLYAEEDKPDPVNYYGVTKLEAEERVRGLDGSCVVRASVLFGARPAAGKVNFALWLLDKLKSGEPVDVLVDQWNSPTLNSSMADLTLELLRRGLKGVFHVCGASRVSRFDFAVLVARTFGFDSRLVRAVSSDGFSWTARRPRDSSLSTVKVQRMLRCKPLTIESAVEALRQELAC